LEQVSHRIIELLRLEKTSKIMKSNRQPNSTMPAKSRPEVHIFQRTDFGLFRTLIE